MILHRPSAHPDSESMIHECRARKWPCNGGLAAKPTINGDVLAGWGPQDSVQLVYKCLNSMVYGRYNELVNGDYKGL